jgi:hypothetical protein
VGDARHLKVGVMVSVILSELQSWNSGFSKRSLFILLSGMAAVCVFGTVNPKLCSQAAIVFFIWLGWLSGKQSWSDPEYSEWMRQSEVSVTGFMFGKLLSVTAICILHIFFIMPVFILMMIMWGVPLHLIFQVFLPMITSSLIAFLFTFVFNRRESEPGSYEFIGMILIISWILLTFIFPILNNLNPLIQAGKIIETGNPLSTIFFVFLNSTMLFFLFLFTDLFLIYEK